MDNLNRLGTSVNKLEEGEGGNVKGWIRIHKLSTKVIY